ncbi:MAG: RnfABCDGE type electron transport complex subunit D, partial [Oscillospiraceae bacterium]|nr:RnfABCDGE type electron transport complex subunit D [Oscillospiraceae bacterium]
MEETRKLIVSSSPHIRTPRDTRAIMLDVLIALLPALIASLILFGVWPLVLTVISVVSCVAFEFLYRKLMKKPNTVGDLSAIVTGVLLAYTLPTTAPWWLPV